MSSEEGFVLSAQLHGLEADATSVTAFYVAPLSHAAPGSSSSNDGVPAAARCVAASSRDGTIRVWAAEIGSNRFQSVAVLRGHTGFVGRVRFVPPGHPALAPFDPFVSVREDWNAGALISCGRNDRRVYIWSVPLTAIFATLLGGASAETIVEPVGTLVGHEDLVNSVDVCPDGTIVTSGLEGDKTVRVWRGAECVAVLKGHAHGVWDVLCIPDHSGGFSLASVSADDKLRGSVRIWTQRGGNYVCTAELNDHRENVRGLALVPTLGGFASCANDGQILLYTAAGECIGAVPGHEQYVYAICSSPDPRKPGQWRLVSVSEDRTMRVTLLGENSSNTCPHPSTVWHATTFNDSRIAHVPGRPSPEPSGPGLADIVTACADGVVRVFTPEHAALAADPETIQLYQEALAAQTLSAKGGQVGDINIDTLPGMEALDQPGRKDGQIIMVKRQQGPKQVVEAHSWSAASGSWTKVGEVFDTASDAQSTRNIVKGKTYDHVWDVDLEDGLGHRKLGYNTGDNIFSAAQQFIDDNDVDQQFLHQIADFIEKQATPVTLGEAHVPVVNNLTAPNRYIPGAGETRAAISHFPMTSPLLIDARPATAAVVGKICQFFEQETGSAPSASFSEDITGTVNRLVGADSSPLTSGDVDRVVNLVRYSEERRVPGLDLIRLVVLRELPADNADIMPMLWSAVSQCGFQSSVVVNRTLALRFAVNAMGAAPTASQKAKWRRFFSDDPSRVQSALDAASDLLDFASTNANARLAASTLLLAVALNSRDVDAGATDEVTQSLSMLSEYLVAFSERLADPSVITNHSEPVYRCLVSLGTFVYLRPALAALARDLDMLGCVTRISQSALSPTATKLVECARELQRYLQ